MIALEDQKILICTPNKCSSTTVSLTLIRDHKAHMICGPQGYWKKYSLNYHEPIGKHTCFNNPCLFLGYKRVMIYREHFDRYVSLWKHHCRHHKKEISFPDFISFVEENANNPNNWFYNWKMRDMIEEFKPEELIPFDQLEQLNSFVGSPIQWPQFNRTDHDPWQNYYDPSLYRRVHVLS